MIQRPQTPRLHIVTGKGGVGTSTVCAALALSRARRGERVLAIEVGRPGGLSRLFGLAPRPGLPLTAAPGLAVACFEGAAALAEYLAQVVRLGPALERVFSHPLYTAFVGAAPGVRELMVVGKIRDELRKTGSDGPYWDRIVVDAGASGHAVEYLRMPAAAARTFRRGRVHREATRIDALLTDAARTAVHVVALPEEMPLAEAAEVTERLRGDLHMPLRSILVNQCREPEPAGLGDTLGTLAGLAGPAAAGLHGLALREHRWTALQERALAAFEQRVAMPVVRLPRVIGASPLEVLVPLLDRELA